MFSTRKSRDQTCREMGPFSVSKIELDCQITSCRQPASVFTDNTGTPHGNPLKFLLLPSWRVSPQHHPHFFLSWVGRYSYSQEKCWLSQTSCPLVGEWINRLWYIQTMECNSLWKRSPKKTWRNFTWILLGERSQCGKDTYCLVQIYAILESIKPCG